MTVAEITPATGATLHHSRAKHRDGREFIVCQVIGHHAMGFALPAGQPLGADDAAQGLQKLEVLPVDALEATARLPWIEAAQGG